MRQEGTRVGLSVQSPKSGADCVRAPPAGRPTPKLAGDRPNPDGVFESCDARLRHVGGQFTVLDGNVSEVSSMSFTMRCWSPCGTPCGPRQHAG